MTYESFERRYGKGGIRFTVHPSSRRISVEVTATNAVMDWSELLALAEELQQWTPKISARTALTLIGGQCTTSTGVGCAYSGRKPNAEFAADRWCDACIARAGLAALDAEAVPDA